MSERLTHSKAAIASTILPIAIWIYLGLLGLLVIWKPFLKFLNRIFGDSFGALGAAFILAIFLFGIIPFAGHQAGAICSIIGLFSKDKKRIFAVIGLVLNILPFGIGLILYETNFDFGIK